MTEKQKLKYMTDRLFPSKVYSYDILYDLNWIIKERLELFKHSIDEFEKERAEDYLQELIEFTSKPKFEYEYLNRVYIISGIQFVGMACVGLSDAAITNIKTDVFAEVFMCDSLPIMNTDPNLISTIYIFQKNNVHCWHIYPSDAMWILQSLSSKNIVNYRLKQRWTIKD